MKRPSIKSPCVADRYHLTGERIAEVSFPKGAGALISVRETSYGPTIEVYRADPGVQILTSAPARAYDAPTIIQAIEAVLTEALMDELIRVRDGATCETLRNRIMSHLHGMRNTVALEVE